MYEAHSCCKQGSYCKQIRYMPNRTHDQWHIQTAASSENPSEPIQFVFEAVQARCVRMTFSPQDQTETEKQSEDMAVLCFSAQSI